MTYMELSYSKVSGQVLMKSKSLIAVAILSVPGAPTSSTTFLLQDFEILLVAKGGWWPQRLIETGTGYDQSHLQSDRGRWHQQVFEMEENFTMALDVGGEFLQREIPHPSEDSTSNSTAGFPSG